MLLEQAHDLHLLRPGRRRAGAAPAGVPYGELHRCRTVPVLAIGIGAAVEKGAHRRGAACAYRTMQGRNTTFVSGVRIGARFDQNGDCRCLGVRIPSGRPGKPISGIVKRLAATAVPGANIGTGRKQLARDLVSIAGGSDMQRRITFIDVVLDFFEIEVNCSSARRAPHKAYSRQICRSGQQTRRGCHIVGNNRLQKPPERIVTSHACLFPSGFPSRSTHLPPGSPALGRADG